MPRKRKRSDGNTVAKAVRSRRQEISDTRGESVYNNDNAIYTGTEKAKPLPKKGSPEREELVRKAKELKAAGKTNIEIEIELDVSNAYILLKE